MRLFVSTVVVAVVLALWLPVTADFDYAVTAAEHALPGKSYINLLFASCAVAYSVVGLFRLPGASQVSAVHPHDEPAPTRAHAATIAKGCPKRHHKKNAWKSKQRHALSSTASCRAVASACTSVPPLALAQEHDATNNDATNQGSSSKRTTRSRRSLDRKCCLQEFSRRDAQWVAGPDEAFLQAGHELQQAAAREEDARTPGASFTVAPCWKRQSRLGRSSPACVPLPTDSAAAAAAATAASKELLPPDRLITIEEQLPGLARTLEYVPGEGNCQFCSVCMLMEGSWENHLQLRQRVCDHMAANEALFAPFVPSSSLASYLSDMRQPCSWGDELTLTAMADLLRRELRVVTDHHEGEQGVHAYVPLGGPTVEEPIYMWFRHGHYNPLLPQST